MSRCEATSLSQDPSFMGRYAAIDIGTVTCRLLVVDVYNGELIEHAREVSITNLGEDVDATGILKAEAIERVREQIVRFKGIIDSFCTAECPTVVVRAIATSASRDAENSDEFIAMLQEVGVELMVITGDEEASLSFKGASSVFPHETIMVVDIGGGSTELIIGSAHAGVQKKHSFDVGCRRVTDRFFVSDPPSPEEINTAYAWVRECLYPFFDGSAGVPPFEKIVAVAGTATSVVSIRDEMVVYDSTKVHKSTVSRTEFEKVYEKLRSASLEERKQIVGLDPRRAHVIVAGMVILDSIFDLSHQESFVVSEFDILQGIILDAVAEKYNINS